MIDVDGVDRVEEEILERRVDLLVQVAVALFDVMSPDCTNAGEMHALFDGLVLQDVFFDGLVRVGRFDMLKVCNMLWARFDVLNV